MGDRIYLPNIGRFSQVDPVEGGTPNNYVYPPDPVNDLDLNGEFGWSSLVAIATVASFIPGPVGMIGAGVGVAGNLAQGHWEGAAVAATGLLGAGVAGKVATKVGLVNKFVAPIVRVQSKIPIAGKKSLLFGNSKYTTFGRGLLNGRYANSVKIGWSNNAGKLTYRVGVGKKVVNNRRIVSSYHIDYGRLGLRF